MNGLTPLWVSGLIGYAWQWARGPQKFPNWLGYALAAGLTVGGWFYAEPHAGLILSTDWRSAVGGIVGMYLAARGIASASSEAKIAPKTNSL